MSRQVGLDVNEIIHSYLYPYDNPFRELWFIVTLFIFFVLTPLWRWVIKEKWTMWGCLVMLAFLHFFHPTTTLLCFDRVCNYAIWFYAGLIISKEEIVDRTVAKKPWMAFIIGLAVYVLGMFTNPSITTLGGITISFALALIADKHIPKLFCGFCNYIYQIFLMGIFAQMSIKILYKHINNLPYLPIYILCILVGLYVPVIVSKLLEQINWKPLLLYVGLKYKKYTKQ